MDRQLIILILLTYIINLISTLAYAVRIAGVRVRRIAISLSLFNVLVLGSRIANSFQAPLLAKRIEDKIMGVVSVDILRDLRWLLAAAAVATIAGGILTPTVQRIFQKAVARFSSHHSTFRLLWEACSPKGMRSMLSCACWPSANNITQMRRKRPVALSMITMNAVATAIWTLDEADYYLRHYGYEQYHKGKDVLFLRDSPWMVVFKGGKAVDLYLIKGV